MLTRKAKMKTMEEYKLPGEGEKPNTKIYNGKESWVLIPYVSAEHSQESLKHSCNVSEIIVSEHLAAAAREFLLA